MHWFLRISLAVVVPTHLLQIALSLLCRSHQMFHWTLASIAQHFALVASLRYGGRAWPSYSVSIIIAQLTLMAVVIIGANAAVYIWLLVPLLLNNVAMHWVHPRWHILVTEE
jgi:hypothetical protein